MTTETLGAECNDAVAELPLLDRWEQALYDVQLIATTQAFNGLVAGRPQKQIIAGRDALIIEYEPLDMGVHFSLDGDSTIVGRPLVTVPRKEFTAPTQDSPGRTTYVLEPQVFIKPGMPVDCWIATEEPGIVGYHSIDVGARPTSEALVNLERFRRALDQIIQTAQLKG